jgi:cytochrome c peroxidase
LVASNFLSDSLSLFDAEQLRLVRHIALNGPRPDQIRQGEILFHSAKLTHLGQFSCASCHPGGGADGLNWDLPRDGVANPKNTRALWGCRETAPYGWLGSSPTLADRIVGTLRTAHRYEPSPAELAALVAYVAALPPPPPADIPAGKRAAYQRGRALFFGKAGCAACHPPDTYQDGQTHDVGTGDGVENRFDTPSLRGLRFTAPYLHDGRAATLEEIFTKYNLRHRHGQAHTLTPEELSDLLVFLESL